MTSSDESKRGGPIIESTSNPRPKFWFKASATTPSFLPIAFEGGLYAETLKGALDSIDTRSRYWNIKHINMVHVYEMDKDGVIGKDPVVSVNHALERAHNYSRKDNYGVVAIAPIPKEPTVIDEYNDSNWLYKLDTPDPFPVVRHNEESKT